MKKSLLVISVILLIAGLFISCNSEAAGTNSEVGYVKFGGSDDSKALDYTITPESHEPVNSLYWYYKASPVNPGLFTQGTKDSWTAVSSSTGLSGTIGPFSKGTWSFEIVGSSSDTAPSAGTSFNGSTWTIAEADDGNIKYYGVSGSTYNVKTSVYIHGSKTAPTLIPVGLKYNSHATVNTFTLTLSSVTLLQSTTGDNPITVNDGYTVYYDVKNSSNSVVMSGSVVTANGAATITSASETVTSTSGTSATFTVSAYTDSARTNEVNHDSVTFVPNTGSTVTVYGNLGHLIIETGYGQFADIDSTQYEAYIYDGSTYTGKETLTAALSDAIEGNMVGLLRDVAYTSGSIEITKGITLEGNGHTITNTRPASGSDLNGNRDNRDAAVYLNNAGKTVSINNLNITTTNIGFIYVGTSDTNGTKADGGTINVSNCDFRTAGSRYGFFVNNCVDNLTVNINGSTLLGYAAIYSKSQHSAYNISNSTLYGYNTTSTAPSNGFGTVVIDANTKTTVAADVPNNQGCYNTVVIDNCTIYAQSDSTNVQLWLCLQYAANHNTVTVTNTHMYPAPSGTEEITDYRWEYSYFNNSDGHADDEANGAQATNTVTVDGVQQGGFRSNHS